MSVHARYANKREILFNYFFIKSSFLRGTFSAAVRFMSAT